VYTYPWNYIAEGETAEEQFTAVLTPLIRGKVLDVGCGHGEYTSRWSAFADEVVGLDVTEAFLQTAGGSKSSNMSFVLHDTRRDLPFTDREFDVAYTKKGPTSWYPGCKRIMKPGGDVVALHPGGPMREGQLEGDLGCIFPGLFNRSDKDMAIDKIIQDRLDESGLTSIQIRVIEERGYLPSPEDVLNMVCFGQTTEITRHVREQCFDQIKERFERFCSAQGLLVIGRYFLVTAKA
jgi:23S rRNA (guanine745-N1)-methyltransferase